MKRLLLAGVLLGLLGSGSGCAMCAHPWDYAYGTYGGKWARGDQFNGRVNSAFAPAGGEMISEGEEGEVVAPQPEKYYQPGSSMHIHAGELDPSPEVMEN